MIQLLRRISNRLCHLMARQLPGATGLRIALHRFRGVTIGTGVFIGDDVYLENEYPERLEIHDGVLRLTAERQEAALGDATVERHLPALEPAALDAARAGALALGAHAGVLAVARARAPPDTLAPMDRAGRGPEIFKLHGSP